MDFFLDPNGQFKVFTQLKNQKKTKKTNADWFCGHYDTVFEATGCFCHGCDCRQKDDVTMTRSVKNMSFGKDWKSLKVEHVGGSSNLKKTRKSERD